MFKISNFTMKPLYVAIQMGFLASGCLLSKTAAAVESNQTESLNSSLSTIVITARKSAVTEESESYTVDSASTATKLNLSLRDTPQAVKVYTREYLDDRNIDSLQELMSTVTGVTASRTDERQSYYARGFQVDYSLIDGLPSTLNLSEGDMDLSIFDRVEVVKGANGLMTGAGNPAIGLNLIRKHANATELTGSVNASVGSWDSYASNADISAPLNADGSLRGRVFVKHSDENSFMDFYSRERNVAYAAIDYDMSDSTSLSLAATYQELNRDGIRWGGLPAFYNDGSRTQFDRSLTVSSDWTYWNTDTTALFAGLKHKLYGDINLNLNYSYRRDDKESALLYVYGDVDKASNKSVNGIDDVSVYMSEERNDENNADIFINVPFTLFDFDQEVIFGGSWNQKELKHGKYGGSFYTGQNVLNVDALDFSNMATQLILPVDLDQITVPNTTTQTGAYLAGRFQLMDALKIVAGARISNWEYEAKDGKGNREFNNEITPYLGLVYDVASDHSVYASYTSIFKPQSRRDMNAEYLDPTVGKNYETGIKSEWFGGRLNTALSVFRIEQSNVAVGIKDALNAPVNISVNGKLEQAYRNVDGVVSEGVEFEMDGEINDNWGINFGIANFEAKDANDQKFNTNSARTTSNLFVKYKMDKWRAGAGLNYRSKTYDGTGVRGIEQGDIVLASALLGYQVDPNISVQLNLENLFDKEYYEGIGANSMNYGAPRNVTLGVRYKF
ncbi:MAG: TonB-dependent siderophore receptor [Moraxellaceae bacterium]|nr:MAG: TonB-dependent siderophore receptor [Moraxellaceae bacterium]